jgi:hypothetical protein
MHRLAEASGLRLGEIFYDSFSLQFTGSEKYRRDIPLVDKSHDAELFPSDLLARYARESEKLNERHEGDQAGFFLIRPVDEAP